MWLALVLIAQTSTSTADVSRSVSLDPPNILSTTPKNRFGFGLGVMPSTVTQSIVTGETQYELLVGKRFIVGIGSKVAGSPATGADRFFLIRPVIAGVDAILYEAHWGRFLAGGDLFFPSFARRTHESDTGTVTRDELWIGAEARLQQVFRLWRGGEAAAIVPMQVHYARTAGAEAAIFAVGGRIELRQRLHIAVLYARIETMFNWSSNSSFDLTPMMGSIYRPAMSLGVRLDL